MNFNGTPRNTATTATGDTRLQPVHGATRFDPPEVMFVGNACDIVMGPPGGGFDGPYGITDPQFEFEEDGSC